MTNNKQRVCYMWTKWLNKDWGWKAITWQVFRMQQVKVDWVRWTYDKRNYCLKWRSPPRPFPLPYENGEDKETNHHGTLPYKVWVGTLLLSLFDLFIFPESKGFNCPYSCPIFFNLKKRKHNVYNPSNSRDKKPNQISCTLELKKSSIQDPRVYDVYNRLMVLDFNISSQVKGQIKEINLITV
jgi:hypothetical protein